MKKEVAYIHIGHKLKLLREHRHMTQGELAMKIGKEEIFVQELESQANWGHVFASDLRNLCLTLDITSHYFFDDISLHQHLEISKIMADPEFKNTMSMFHELPNEKQMELKDMLIRLSSYFTKQ